jgi:nitroimidazol reductase NimA-like FMN-containing flavoprotein (pyridoxamine 5'-phosphate oxidase superfamily)
MEERPMRRKDREISEQEARQLLAQGEYGVLSTVSPDGAPYGVPISYVYHQGEIFFHSAPEGRKVEYLTAGARASFCVVGATEILPEKFSTRYESAIASGEIRELDGDEKRAALTRLVEKYAPEFRPQGEAYIAQAEDTTRVFALCVRHLTGKRRR